MIQRRILLAILLATWFMLVFAFGDSVDGAPSDVAYQTHGLNFSPYIEDDEDPNMGGSQITNVELEERIDLIAPYAEWIRTFACNDDLSEAGMYAHVAGLKAAVGAWLGRNPAENDSQITRLIELAKEGHVDIAIVGSEVLLRGDLSETDLIHYINEVKDSLDGAGVDIPVTYADVYGMLLGHPNVISAVDVVFANYYPYWEGRKIDYAIAYVHRQHRQLVDAAGGKEVIVSESGWPSCGNQIGEAVPSLENASFYFMNFVSWARANNVKYFSFEAYDEGWKARYEGPQGACWGIWNKEGNLKPGMQSVFDGDTTADNWSAPIPDAPIIDFAALPGIIETNIPTFIVAGFTEPNNAVWLNGTPLSSDAIDADGNFAFAAPLVGGDNSLSLVITSGEDTVAIAEKVVRFNETFCTYGNRLLYVNSVPGEGVPGLPGTIVIDLDNSSLLGLIEGKYVVGISPDGSEVYASDRTVISTRTHRELRTLAFTQDIPINGFIVSPDGDRLYSRNERLDVPSNTLLDNLPLDITTGSSWCSAPIPGGPTIADGGGHIYCRNNVSIIDTEGNTFLNTGITGYFMSDIAFAPDSSKILVSEYSYESGNLDVYDSNTFEALGTIYGLGDFAGEIAFSKDGERAVVGSAGNPAHGNGRVSVVSLDTLKMVSQIPALLADNLATSGNNEFFVSCGESGLFRRLGVDVFVLEPYGSLVRTKTFFLGINGFKASACKPANDQIRRIVFKPAKGSTGVTFASAYATGKNGYVTLSWWVAVDVSASSFRIERSEMPRDGYTRLQLVVLRDSQDSFSCVDRTVEPGRTYWYRIVLVGPPSEESYGPIEVRVDTVPVAYHVYQSYPNPSNPLCTIRYAIARAGHVSLRVFDVSGTLVRTLADGWREPGVYSEVWDGRGGDGTALPSGVYFYRLEAADFVATRKMVLLH